MENLKEQTKKKISSDMETISKYPHFSEIKCKMEEAQESIGYYFDEISLLMVAFCRTKIDNGKGKNNDTYVSDTLATLGDSVLHMLLVEYFFLKGKDKQEINDCAEELEKNETLTKIRERNKWTQYLYHECYFYDTAPKHNQVSISASGHEPCIEAIIGAIYLDKGMDAAWEWIFKYIVEPSVSTDV